MSVRPKFCMLDAASRHSARDSAKAYQNCDENAASAAKICLFAASCLSRRNGGIYDRLGPRWPDESFASFRSSGCRKSCGCRLFSCRNRFSILLNQSNGSSRRQFSSVPRLLRGSNGDVCDQRCLWSATCAAFSALFGLDRAVLPDFSATFSL